MSFMANDYRGRPPRYSEDSADRKLFSVMIHAASCKRIPSNPGSWWTEFDSLEAALAAFDDTATCFDCLGGRRRHIRDVIDG